TAGLAPELSAVLVTDEPVARAGDRPQVLDAGRALDGREEVVGQLEALGIHPVVRDADERGRRRDLWGTLVLHVARASCGALPRGGRAVQAVETVHLAAVD